MDEKTISLSKLPVDVKVRVGGAHTLGTNLDYRALFEQTGECAFIIGLDFKFITANRQAQRLLGYDESQLSGMPVEEIMPLQDAGERDALLEKRLTVSELTLKKKNGKALPVEVSISVVHDDAGMPAYIQMLARDISDRKQSEKILRRHVRALSVIGEATARLFRSPNIEATIPEVLESFAYAMDVFCCALFNIHAPSLKVRYQWLSPEAAGFNVAAALQPFLESIAENSSRVFSVTDVPLPNPNIPFISLIVIPIQGAMGSLGFLVLMDKENRLTWVANEFDAIQTVANLIAAALDRVRYERTIQLSEIRNRVIVDALPDLLLRVDLTGRILDYNANSSHPLYVPRMSVIGKKLQDLWSPEVAKMIVETDSQDGFVSSHWVYGFSLPGREQTFEARLHPISSDEALVVVRDITEQARLDQMKSDFLNRASHELRTPLTAAIMMAELLQQGGTKEETEEYWKVLMSELNRQKDLINQLLLAGRLESGKMQLEIAPLDLMAVLNESIQGVRVIARKHNIPIETYAEETAVFVLGDKGGLSQVFINLINNAVKFSPEGKSVEVTVQKGTEYVTIGIVDHGLGIPPDAIPHLFERFYRAKNVTVAEIPGSGIGLYIVKSIIDELGGSISVESEINKGTKFTVRLKRAPFR